MSVNPEEIEKIQKKIEDRGTKEAPKEKWWIWIILATIAFALAFGLPYIIKNSEKTASNSASGTNTLNTSTSYSNVNNIKKEEIKKVEVTIIDFSNMAKDEIKNWCETNKIVWNFTESYSDTVEKGLFVSQSISADKIAYQGDKITITYSLGRQPTNEERNALKKAESYSKTMHMSKKGIYEQLTSEYGEGFTAEAAQYAIDNLNVDYKANALAKAKSYQKDMSMSKNAIYEQLISPYGEDFTEEEAQYAIDNLDD